MLKKLLQNLSVFAVVLLFLSGCEVSELQNADTNNPDGITEEIINIDNYTATTPEAQAVIDGIKNGKTQDDSVVYGGFTDDMIKKRSDEILSNSQVSEFGSILKSTQPSTKPNSASTRPKIYWVGKKYGPGETYVLNSTGGVGNNSVYSIMSLKTSYWVDVNRNSGGNILYRTALLQSTGSDSNTVTYGDYGNKSFSYKVLSIDHPVYNDDDYITLLYDKNNNSSGDYVFSDIESNVFESVSGFPIQRTWYAKPARHFEKICINIKSSGAVTYGAVTQSGSEAQFMVFRWDKNDFNTAYSGTGGWHSQGWYIKDFDVTNGIVTAILYVPQSSYTEVKMWGVTDEYFSQRIGSVYWPKAYRGLIIDSSW